MRFLLVFLLILATVSARAQTRFVRAVNTIADLVSASNNPAQIHTNIFVAGYRSDSDGGGGIFEWIPGTTIATNLGTVFASKYPGAVGRFKRQYDGALHLEWFGTIKATGPADFATGITENNAALVSALAALNNLGGGALEMDDGIFNYTTPVILPPVGSRGSISGTRRDGTYMRYLGIGSAMSAAGSPVGAAWLFRNFSLDGTGNGNVVNGLVVVGDANRDLKFEGFGVHNFNVPGSVGLTIDGVHSVVGDIKLDYNNINFEFGKNQFFNSANLFIISENARTNGYSGLMANGIGVTFDGTYESAGPILVTNCTNIKFNGYFENNLPGSLDFVHNKNVTVNAFFDGYQFNDYGIRLGDNNFPSLGHGYNISGGFQFLGAAIVIGDGNGGLGPRTPTVDMFTTFAIDTNILFETNLELGPMNVRLNGIDYCYNAAGVIESALNGPINGSASLIVDYSGATNKAAAFPRVVTGSEPSTVLPGSMAFAPNTARFRMTIDGTNWTNVGFGDGNVTTVGNGLANFYPKWSGGNLTLSSLSYDNGNTLGVGTTNPLPNTTLHIEDTLAPGTNAIAGSSSTVVIRNNGIAAGANALEIITSAGRPLVARNDGNVGLPSLGAGKLLRTDGSSNIVAVTGFVGVTWDGFTLTASGGGGGATNAIIAINGDTNTTQTIALGTAGTDYNIVDGGGGLHTINLPTASSVNRGALSSADWIIFNNKGNGTINPTDGFFPYRSNSTTFGDSPLKVDSISTVTDSYRAADNFGPSFVLQKQGRIGSATNTPVSGSILGAYSFGGWNGTGDVYGQSLMGITTEDWSVGANGFKLQIRNVAQGSATQRILGEINDDFNFNASITTNYLRRSITNISTGSASYSANGPGIVIWTNSSSTTVTLLNVPTVNESKFSFVTLGDGVSTNGFTCSTHTIEWQTSQVNTPANGLWTTYDFDQIGTKLLAYVNYTGAGGGSGSGAPTNTLVSLSTPATSGGLFYAGDTIGTNATAATGLTVTSGVNLNVTGDLTSGGTNVLGAIAGKLANTFSAVTNILAAPGDTNGFFRADGTWAIPPGGGTNGVMTYYQTVGVGTDFNYLTASDLYQKISFGTSGPGFTITNAGTYQILLTAATFSPDTFPQTLYLTNITDSALVQGPFRSFNTSSDFWPIVFSFQITTTGANKVFEVWGKTADSTYSNAGVAATKTFLDVVCLSCGGGGGGGGGTGDFVGPASSTDNAIVRFDGTTGKLGQNSVVTISDTTGNIKIGDSSQATVTITGDISGTDVVASFGSASLNVGTAVVSSGGVNANNSASGSFTAGDTGVFRFGSTSTRISASTNGWARMANAADTDFFGLRFGGFTSSSLMLMTTNQQFHLKLSDNSAYAPLFVLDDAYNATTWATNTQVPTKKAVRDKIESMSGSGDNWVASGTTNSTLPGIAYPHEILVTNNITVGTSALNIIQPSTVGSSFLEQLVVRDYLQLTNAAIVPSSVLYLDAAKKAATLSTVSPTELGYLDGVTGGIQTNLDNRVPNPRSITIAGTANEIESSTGAQDLSADRTWTLSLPAVIDLGGKTSLEIPNSVSPVVSVFGQVAGANSLWAASRGAPIFHDGTAAIALVGTLVSDTPSNGQVPTWNTGGTITWETPSAGGGGSAPTNTLVGTTFPATLNGVSYSPDTIGTNRAVAVGVTIGSTTNLSVTGTITESANGIVSQPNFAMTGLWYSGGSATTTKPHLLIEPFGTTSTGWPTGGTAIGINQASGGTADFLHFDLAGANVFSVTSGGTIATTGSMTVGNGTGFRIGSTRSQIISTADGNVTLVNSAGTGLTTVLLGADDSSPDALVNIRSANGVGTDIIGGALAIDGGGSTGTGAGGDATLRTTFSAKATGSTANTRVDRFRVVAKGKALTDATAVSLFEVALPTLKGCGGKIEAVIKVTDGTDVQEYAQSIQYTAANKGGSYTTNIRPVTSGVAGADDGSKSLTAGTLTAAWTILTGTDKITIQLNADTSLTPSTLSFLVYYTITNNSEQAITVL